MYLKNTFWGNKNTVTFRFQRVVQTDNTDVNLLLFIERTYYVATPHDVMPTDSNVPWDKLPQYRGNHISLACQVTSFCYLFERQLMNLTDVLSWWE